MDASTLRRLLQHAADEQLAPTPAAIDVVTARAHRLRTKRRAAVALAALASSAAIAGGIVAIESNTRHPQTVSMAHPNVEPSAAWRIDATALTILHDYTRPDGQISAVSQVQMKKTNWASYVVWARNTSGDLPLSGGYSGSGDTAAPVFDSSTPIYVIAQTGTFNCATIYGCHGRTYNWVLNIIKVGDPAGGGLITASPNSTYPPSMATLPGPAATLNTQTGTITTTSPTPPPGIPTIAVPAVIGINVATAVNQLQDAGFSTLGPDHSAIRMGVLDQRHITGQEPPAGSLAPAGSAVTVTLSN